MHLPLSQPVRNCEVGIVSISTIFAASSYHDTVKGNDLSRKVAVLLCTPHVGDVHSSHLLEPLGSGHAHDVQGVVQTWCHGDSMLNTL